MNDIEDDLEKIKFIRQLRARSRGRECARRQQIKNETAHAIERMYQDHEKLKDDLVVHQNQALTQLQTQTFVNVTKLVEFTKLQQRGTKSLKDSSKSIDEGHHEYRDAQENYLVALEARTSAERRLFKIEEVIKEQLWK